MHRYVFCLLALAACASAADIQGTVTDPTGAAIPAAEVVAIGRVGVIARTTTGFDGSFKLRIAEPAEARLVATAPGFETRTAPAETGVEIQLAIAPQVDSVRVVGSTIDAPLSEQGSSASIVPREEIAQRNEPMAQDLLRYLPGIALTQAGHRGAASGLFIRGGDSDFNLVQIDGVVVNAFGGAFDLAHIPADRLERIEVIRGPQSAVHGSYANSGVINLVTRQPGEGPAFEALAEGGSWHGRRLALGGSAMLAGFGLSGWASRLEGDGPVENSDYLNQGVTLSAGRNFARQSLNLHGNFLSNEVGAPGPYGSDPAGLFPGPDLVSRNRNNFSNYLARYHADLSPRVRQELSGGFFLNNSYYLSPFGDSSNQDLRGQAEARTLVSVTRGYTTSFGLAWSREREVNTWITDDNFQNFPLIRNQEGIYWENRFDLGGRLFWNAGLRAELIHTGRMPGSMFSGRPEIAAHTLTKVNPKLAASFVARPGTRLFASFGTGIRPPSGFEIAFTDNPALRPERTTSFDAGVEQRMLSNRLSLGATYFYNRFSDLIVSLGGSQAQLSSWKSDNLSNSRASGIEFTGRLQASREFSLSGHYTWLRTEILSLDGSVNLAPEYFHVGQRLLRRPEHSGAAVASWSRGRVSSNLTAFVRGTVLDVEPNFGASAGLFENPGFVNLGFNLNIRLASGVTAYGHLRNALNRRYEEVYGYPAPPLNFVAGMKFTLPRGR